jgi:hypothetical protein
MQKNNGSLAFMLKLLSEQSLPQNAQRRISLRLTDSSNNIIFRYLHGDASGAWRGNAETHVYVPIGINVSIIKAEPTFPFDQWGYYTGGSSSFDWEHITKFAVRTQWVSHNHPAGTGGYV